MVRTQISLRDEQMRALRDTAAREGLSVAEVVRQALDAHLARNERTRRRQALLDAIGVVSRPDLVDLSENHDALAWDDD